MRIVVCDMGLGNLRSVERALLEAGRGRADHLEVSNDPDAVASADKLVMPGQGGFRDASRALAGGLGQAVLAHLAAERPYLGICLGLQVLFGWSEEAGATAGGLGVLAGNVVRLPAADDETTRAPLKIPHVGWNVAEAKAHDGSLDLLRGDDRHFYFTHSFAVVPSDPRVIAATTRYGPSFVSAVAYGNVFACQFHPEKSQRAGLTLLERFLAS